MKYKVLFTTLYFKVLFKEAKSEFRVVTLWNQADELSKEQNFIIMKNKRLTGIVLAVAFLLLIPLIAMQFTDEVDWSLFDFIVAGILLLGTGLMCELVMRKVSNIRHRVIICLAILGALFLIWAELAVGIFGTPFAGS